MKFFIFFVLAMVLVNTGPAMGARGRMFNSYDVNPQQYPSLVRLHIFTPSGSYLCSGTLILKTLVLTAAHCMITDGLRPTSIQVFMGSNMQGDPSEKNVTVTSTETNVIVHEYYSEFDPDSHYDIALIRIPKIQTNKDIGLAQLPLQTDYILQTVKVVGWGDLFEGHRTAEFAQWNDFTVYENQYCPSPFESLLSSEMCLYKANVSICSGDSGGPAYYGTQVVGVVSFISTESCESNTAIVASNVAYHKEWIRGHMKKLKKRRSINRS